MNPQLMQDIALAVIGGGFMVAICAPWVFSKLRQRESTSPPPAE